MRTLALVLMIFAAAVQLAPMSAAVYPPLLRSLYEVAPDDATTRLLLRHRAVLLGLVGAALLAGAWVPSWRAPALTLGLASKLSYLALFAVAGPVRRAAAKVAAIDAGTATLLAVAWVALRLAR